MYKKVLKSLHENRKKEPFADLYKSDTGAVRGKQPHFIFSAENPLYPTKFKMSHDDVLGFLNDRGYKAESIKGKYGDHEKSILVHNPPKHAVKHLFNLAHSLGQESSIYSNGHDHEMHFHHGDNAGKHIKGQGTAFHKKPPEDYFYSSRWHYVYT